LESYVDKKLGLISISCYNTYLEPINSLDCGFEYIKDRIKNFLYSIQMISSQRPKALEKNQEDYQHGIGSYEYTLWNTQLWFGRCMLQKDITFRKI